MLILGDFKASVIRAFNEVDPNWEGYRGLVICGSHTPKDPEKIIATLIEFLDTDYPIYGECYGYQLATIAFARHKLGLVNATSEEWDKEGLFVVKKRADGLNVGLKNGESYWNNYEATIDWTPPENFFVAQYHASYQSKLTKPHKLIVNYLKYAKDKM